MKLQFKYFIAVFLIIAASCSPRINYLGKSYTPTQNVDLFFDEHDIKKEYEVMGVMKNEGSELEYSDLDAIKKAMIEKARENGADALLFIGSYQEKVTGESSQIDVDKDGAYATSWNQTSKVVEAKMLKYTSGNN
jgi:hypothetical protein